MTAPILLKGGENEKAGVENINVVIPNDLPGGKPPDV